MVTTQRNDDLAEKDVIVTFPSGRIVLNVTPEEFSARYPTRLDVVQTLTGLLVDSFGYGLGTGQLSGQFGFGRPLVVRPGGADETGLEQAKRLKRYYEEWQNIQAGAEDPKLHPCQLVNVVDDQFYDVVFTSLDWRRSRSNPLVVYYSLPYTILKDYNAPVRASPLVQLGAPPLGDGGTPDFPEGQEIVRGIR